MDCCDEVLIIDGKVVVLNDFPSFAKIYNKLDSSYTVRIYNEDQIVVEKIKNPQRTTGQYYFAIKTCDGVKPKKHIH